MLAPDVSRDYEDRRWNVVTLQQRFGVVEVVSVAVIKRNDDRAVRQVAIEEILG
jgi:hypothetical protein